MHLRRWLAPGVLVTWLGACSTIDLEQTDHDAQFLGVRVRKQLTGEPGRDGSHLEAGYARADGETERLDYEFETLSLGYGVEKGLGERAWLGLFGGLAWHGTDFEAQPDRLESESEFGPYFGVEGGYRATAWLEPYGRVTGAVYFPALGQESSIDAGVRVHAIEHANLFVGWRFTHYELDDFDSGAIGFDSLELDASGLIVVLELVF